MASDLEAVITGFQAMAAGWGADATPERMRADFEVWCERFPDDRAATIARISPGGVPADEVRPDGAPAAARSVLYLHGGGYVLGSARSHRSLAKRIAFEARARVVVPDYRLAPEHPFPAAVDDAVAAYHGLLATAGPERIAVAGDSAGAGLTLALLVSLRDAGTPLPACAVLLSPFADLECCAHSYDRLAAADPIVSREMALGMGRTYVGEGGDTGHPLASPVRAKLDGLPPLLVQVGSREVVLDDAREIERRARAAGVPARLEVWEGMIHAWHLYAAALEDGRRAVAELAAFVRSHTKD
jgi:epsilon-lactone hydrolase